MTYFVNNVDRDISIIASAIKLFEAEGDDVSLDTPPEDGDVKSEEPTNVEIAPPPENSEIKNSDFFANGKIRNDVIQNDPAVQNLIKIISADMQDEESIKIYIDAFFTKIGLNDVSPENFKLLSSDIWDKLDQMSNLDERTSLADFITWAKSKIDQYNKQ